MLRLAGARCCQEARHVPYVAQEADAQVWHLALVSLALEFPNVNHVDTDSMLTMCGTGPHARSSP